MLGHSVEHAALEIVRIVWVDSMSKQASLSPDGPSLPSATNRTTEPGRSCACRLRKHRFDHSQRAAHLGSGMRGEPAPCTFPRWRIVPDLGLQTAAHSWQSRSPSIAWRQPDVCFLWPCSSPFLRQAGYVALLVRLSRVLPFSWPSEPGCDDTGPASTCTAGPVGLTTAPRGSLSSPQPGL
jgi:hypothetical protein